MGLFDLPAPVFTGLDGLLGAALPPAARLVLWAVLGGVLSMALYKLLSPQAAIARVKKDALEARVALNAYDGEFEGAWPLMRRMLGLSFKQLGIVIGPAVLASLPILSLLAWVSTSYGHAFPAGDAAVGVRAGPGAVSASWVPPAAASPAPRVVVADGGGRVLDDIALNAPVPVVHKKQWWNLLLGNPVGYLAADAPVDRVEIDLPRQEFLPFGPGWARSWEVPFFLALLLSSILVKVVFRIE